MLRMVIFWLARTDVATFVRNSSWAWAVLEISHFMGLSMLLGTVGLFDLRLMGYAKQIPPKALHRLVAVGIAGFAINMVSGTLFFFSSPGLYIGNVAFEIKLVLLVAAAFNVAAFYFLMRRPVMALEAGAVAPLPARIIGGLSLCIWVSVLVAGRMEAFFKPIAFSR
jgi:hypothetical protein